MKWRLAAFLFVSFAVCFAQQNTDPAIGFTPYGAYDGSSIDHVDEQSLNLILHEPLVGFAQRGGKLTLNYNIGYNAKEYKVTTRCNRQGCTTLRRRRPRFSGVYVYDTQYLQQIPQQCNWSKGYVVSTFAVTADGSYHLASVTPNSFNTAQNDGETLDDTSIKVDVGNGVLTDANGSRYSYPINGSGTFIKEDLNGNEITSSNITGANADTLGRTFSSTSTTNFSGCTGPRTTTGASLWNVPGYGGGTVSYKFCYANVALLTNFRDGQPQYSNTIPLLQSIVLPTGKTYTFEFNDRDAGDSSSVNYGSLTKVTLPTGGTISYTWQTIGQYDGNRSVVSRTVNGLNGTHSWSYSQTRVPNLVTTKMTDPNGNDTVYTYSNVHISQPTKIDYYQGSSSGNSPLKSTSYTYNVLTLPTSTFYGCVGTIYEDVHPTAETTTLQNGLVSEIDYQYDPGFTFFWIGGTYPGSNYTSHYGLKTAVLSYDYGSGSKGSLLRKDSISYLAFSNGTYKTDHILSLPASIVVSDGTNTCSETDYAYDDTTRLVSSGITQSHVSSPWGATRGNVSSVTQKLTTTPCQAGSTWTNVVSYVDVFDTGMKSKDTDARNNPTTYAYSATDQGAYLTTVTNPLFPTNFGYDFNTGALTSTTDPNGQPVNRSYDNVVRLTGISYPDGGGTTLCYSDVGGSTCSAASSAPYGVVRTQAITTTANLTTTASTDGFGRITQSQITSDPDGTDIVDTTYDASGRMTSQSNPHRSASLGTDGTTTYMYDALGRQTNIGEPGSANISTTYTGNTATVTDEAGRKRKTQTDALGRATFVWEDPSGLNYETDYTYDPLGNLTSVTQKGGSTSTNWRIRRYAYDSLSRLLTASDPESGTVCYGTWSSSTCTDGYDGNGNLLSRTTPAPNQTGSGTVTTSYTYDALNRVTRKSYNDGTTPAVQYGYDGNTLAGCTITPPSLSDSYPTGRRTSMCDGSGAASWNHDQMGRISTEKRTLIGSSNVTKSISSQYNLDGSRSSLMYPSGNTVSYTYNDAGRPVSAIDSTNNINYVKGATYWPAGELNTYIMGQTSTFSGVTETNQYNNRLQQSVISAATTSQTVFSLSYGYGSAAQDNGNVLAITNGLDSTRNQTFTYDSLNRLTTGQSAATSGATCWGQQFGYDAWANLQTISAQKCSSTQLTTTADVHNHLAGYGYDAAGNLIQEGSGSPSWTYTWDAENRLKTISGSASATMSYDGDNQRTNFSSTGLFWRDINGPYLAKTTLTGSNKVERIYFAGRHVALWNPGNAVYYLFEDILGGEHTVTGALGSVCNDLDSLPFGQIITYKNNCSPAYQFAGMEVDSQISSALDYDIARYYNFRMGRFMTPDPLTGHQADPQTLNRYAYVRNNPMSLADPTGLDFNLTCASKNNPSCVNGTQFTTVTSTDANGNQISSFVPTVISNGENNTLVDQNGNQYTATVSGAGVSFSQVGSSSQSSMGVFVNGSNATTIQGSGDLSAFTFNFTSSNLKASVSAAGTFTFAGTPGQAAQALMKAGFQSSFVDDLLNPFHAGSQTASAFNFRSTGDPATGAGAGHFIVEQPVISDRFVRLPIPNVPTTGDLHLGEHNPWGSWNAFETHVQEVLNW